MPLNFVSPGAAAGDALRSFLVEQEAKKRQAMLDGLAQQREGRLAQQDADQHQIAVEQLANSKANEARLEATANQGIADKKRADYINAHLSGDVTSSDAPIVKTNPDLFDSRTTLPAVIAGVMPGTQPGVNLPAAQDVAVTDPQTGAQSTHNLITPESAPPQTQPMITPGRSAQSLGSAPTGESVFRGDAKQRTADKEKFEQDAAVAEMLKSPEYGDDEKAALKMAQGTHNMAAVADIVKSHMDRKATEDVYSADPKTGAIIKTGTVPKGSHFVDKPQPPASIQIANGASDDALDALADHYMQTGQLLTRNASLIDRVMQKVAARKAGGEDPFSNAADLKTDTAALGKLKQQAAAVETFSATARNNIKVLKGTLSKIPDGGARILNMPLRALASQSDPNMAAFTTALDTVRPEISRILSTANATGVNTVHAQGEIEKVLSNDATVGQILASLDVLAQDMENRHASFTDMIKSYEDKIRSHGRGGSGGGGGSAPKRQQGESLSDYQARLRAHFSY